MTDPIIPNIARRNTAGPRKPKTKRSRKAILGEIDRVGVHPVIAWVEHDCLHFHRLHDREDIPPISLRELYRRNSGQLPI